MKKWIVTHARVGLIGVTDEKTTEVSGKNYVDAYVSFQMTHPKEDIIIDLVEKEED